MKRLILGIFLVVWWCGNLVCAQDIAVKTNLLYWATSTPNIGFEFGLGKRTTLDLVGGYNPWTLNKDDNKKIKHWMVMPVLVVRTFQRTFFRYSYRVCRIQYQRCADSLPK